MKINELNDTKNYYQNANGNEGVIGTLSEKTLHAFLKRYYEPNGENQEIKIGGYYADILNDSGIIEIQTQAFNKLRPKLNAFLPGYPVTVVYPIAQNKKICWIDTQTGEITKQRKSTKTGTCYDAFYELYKLKMMLKEPNLHFKLVFLDLTEYRYLDGWTNDKKRGSTRCERIPNSILSELDIRELSDYQLLIPIDLPQSFTSDDFAKSAKIRLKPAQTALNVLNYVGAVKRVGKQGRKYIYEKTFMEKK